MSLGLYAQKPNYWDADWGYGSIVRHRPNIAHLIKSHPIIWTLGYFRPAKPDTWEYRYNYPDHGWLLLHQNFNNLELGSVTALNYVRNYYLLDRKARGQWFLNTGIGLGYSNRPLDFEQNNQNIAISSHVTISVSIKLMYSYPLWKNNALQLGLLFSHFSNSSIHKPNLGVNSLFLDMSMRLGRNITQVEYRDIEEEPLPPQRTHFHTGLQFSFHEVKPAMGVYPVCVWTNTIDRRISRLSGLQFGTDFVRSGAYKQFAEFDAYLYDEPVKDYKQFGIFAGHQLYFDRWYLDTRVGYYVYNPLGRSANVFEYVGMTYRMKASPWRLGFGIKVFNFKADFTSVSVFYQIF